MLSAVEMSSSLIFLLIGCAAVVGAATTRQHTERVTATVTERQTLIEKAVKEVLDHAAASTVQTSADPNTPGRLLSRIFKQASPEAIKQGKARILFESMVQHAEATILEKYRQEVQDSKDAEVKAEVLAQELLHTPGSLLHKDEVAKMYQESGCNEAVQRFPKCTQQMTMHRTASGICNNQQHPLFGVAGTPFRRLIPPQYEDGVSQLRGTMQSQETGLFVGPFAPPNPSARLVSLNVVQDRPETEEGISHLVMQWGQFIDHDLGLSPEFGVDCNGCTSDAICVPIRVPGNDPSFSPEGCLHFARTIPACDSSFPSGLTSREQLNELTSFIDGSQIYGSSETVQLAVREPNSGQLRTGPNFPGDKPSLPIDSNGTVACPPNQRCFLAGDVRVNEQTALIVMHTLWLREHNRIAAELQQINPQWSADKVFLVTREIVGAEIQKITYKDYLPIILGETTFNTLLGDYSLAGGYDPRVNPNVPNAFSAAALRFGHSQIRPFLERLDENFQPAGPLSLVDAFFNPQQYNLSGGTDRLLRGMLSRPARMVDEFVNSILTTRLFETNGSRGMDLASLNIQRGRDHGLPPYNTWKRWAQQECNISSDFENQLTVIRFLQTYGSLETVDLWVGGLAEEKLPGSLLGATFACIFAKTFGPIRHGDRFYYENADPKTAVFTPEQRATIESTSLSRIICDNSDNIREIQPNAFRTDQVRVSCSALPEINLDAWRESMQQCYARIQINQQNSPIAFASYSRQKSRWFSRRSFIRYTAVVDPGENTACLAFVCPEVDLKIQLIIRPTFNRRSTQCSLQQNSLIPQDRAYPSSIYFSVISPQNILSAAGLYNTVESCTTGSNFALNFTCSVHPHLMGAGELVWKLEQALSREQDLESDPNKGEEISLDDLEIPESIRDVLQKDDKLPNEEKAANHESNDSEEVIALLEQYINTLKDQQPVPEKNKESQLISELENALADQQ